MNRLSCAGLRDMAPELVLGVASGHERGDALAHVADCSACQAYVRDLTAAADALLLLAPTAEPPSGFESRVLERVASKRRRGPTRRALGGAVAAAAVAIIAVVLLRGGGDSLRTAELRDGNGRPVGEVFVYEGEPSWVFVSMEHGPDDTYRIELQLADGQVTRQSAPGLRGAPGSWGRAIPVDPERLRVLRVVGNSGWRGAAQFG